MLEACMLYSFLLLAKRPSGVSSSYNTMNGGARGKSQRGLIAHSEEDAALTAEQVKKKAKITAFFRKYRETKDEVNLIVLVHVHTNKQK